MIDETRRERLPNGLARTRIERAHSGVDCCTQEDWLVVKGRNVRQYGFDQYFDLCRLLAERPEYCGANLSWGDAYIYGAERRTGPGNATTWRKGWNKPPSHMGCTGGRPGRRLRRSRTTFPSSLIDSSSASRCHSAFRGLLRISWRVLDRRGLQELPLARAVAPKQTGQRSDSSVIAEPLSIEPPACSDRLPDSPPRRNSRLSLS